jgi:hypothetical protein
MTTNEDRRALAAGPPVFLSRRFSLIGRTGPGVTRRSLPGPLVTAGPYPGPRPACTVTPYREDRCLFMPRYAQPGRF